MIVSSQKLPNKEIKIISIYVSFQSVHPGFKPGDSCINQLLSITHGIHESFDDGYEVRGLFLDISKAFDKLWHKGLINKLKHNRISGMYM